MKFSVIIVSLNPGDKLKKTIDSILAQTDADYEIVIKDGLSTDGSLDRIRSMTDANIRIFEQRDMGIYDAMNQAISHAEGDFYIFMNCGDYFYDDQVLARFKAAAYKTGFSDGVSNAANAESPGSASSIVNVCFSDGAHAVDDDKSRQLMDTPLIIYGNKYSGLTGTVERISPKITPLVLFRNIPCHQAICYSKENFERRLYKPEYKIRADYEHFLWSVLKNKARTVYIDYPICVYEGGGYSESAKNIKRSAAEHREITHMYLTSWQLFYCNLYMIVTLQPLRKKLSSGKFSGIYNTVLKKIYDR